MKINIIPEVINIKEQLESKLHEDNYSEFERIMIVLKSCISQPNNNIDIKRLFYSLLRIANIKISIVEDSDDLAFIEINDNKYNIYGTYGFNLTNGKKLNDEIYKQMKESKLDAQFCYPLIDLFLSQSELKIDHNEVLSPNKIDILTFRDCLCNINKIKVNYTNIQEFNTKILGIKVSLNLLSKIRKEKDPNLIREISYEEIAKRIDPEFQITYTIPKNNLATSKLSYQPSKSYYTKKKRKHKKKKK